MTSEQPLDKIDKDNQQIIRDTGRMALKVETVYSVLLGDLLDQRKNPGVMMRLDRIETRLGSIEEERGREAESRRFWARTTIAAAIVALFSCVASLLVASYTIYMTFKYLKS